MKAKQTLFAAVALSAFAAVLAGSAQARLAEGNGTQPPSKMVVNETVAQVQQASASLIVEPRLARQRAGTLTIDSGIVEPRLARQRAGTLSIDSGICANLDLAIRLAIQQCLSHPVPLATKLRTGTDRAQLKTFPVGYRGRP